MTTLFQGAIGKRLTVYRTGWPHDLEVVGVTSAVRVTRVRDDDVPYFVMPYGEYTSEMSLVIKTQVTTSRMAPEIKRAVDAAHGGRAAFDIRPMDDYVSDSIGDTRFILFFYPPSRAGLCWLAAVGLYGTMAYLTAQPTREFGIRLALGAGEKAILSIVLWEGILLAVAGAMLGLAGVVSVTGVIRELLYGVRPLDGITSICVLAGC